MCIHLAFASSSSRIKETVLVQIVMDSRKERLALKIVKAA